ncbi:hypothetical protein B0H14DRAFT_3668967 [Mycena olivaceomarginata]|nr:hypothetical protein B0H14DRAFT_3668967 [Mycena olivaceomarginata]
MSLFCPALRRERKQSSWFPASQACAGMSAVNAPLGTAWRALPKCIEQAQLPESFWRGSVRCWQRLSFYVARFDSGELALLVELVPALPDQKHFADAQRRHSSLSAICQRRSSTSFRQFATRSCVLVTLHNTMISAHTTNADHEPARRLFPRIFAFVALAFVDPHNAKYADEGVTYSFETRRFVNGKSSIPSRPSRPGQRRTERMKAHLLDLQSPASVVELLALRAFVVLFLAFDSSAYKVGDSRHSRAARHIGVGVPEELQFIWTLIVALYKYIEHQFDFRLRGNNMDDDESLPTTWTEAADTAALIMSASSLMYHRATYPELKDHRPRHFTPAAFQRQLESMLSHFGAHRMLYNMALKCDPKVVLPQIPFAAHGEAPDPGDSTLMQELRTIMSEVDDESHPLPLAWDDDTLPFELSHSSNTNRHGWHMVKTAFACLTRISMPQRRQLGVFHPDPGLHCKIIISMSVNPQIPKLVSAVQCLDCFIEKTWGGPVWYRLGSLSWGRPEEEQAASRIGDLPELLQIYSHCQIHLSQRTCRLTMINAVTRKQNQTTLPSGLSQSHLEWLKIILPQHDNSDAALAAVLFGGRQPCQKSGM